MAHAKDRYTVFIEDLKASQERVTNTVTKDLLIIAGRVSSVYFLRNSRVVMSLWDPCDNRGSAIWKLNKKKRKLRGKLNIFLKIIYRTRLHIPRRWQSL